MTGRGLDQALAHPADPRIHEPVVTDAREYIYLAEAANGPIQRPLDDDYIWGDGIELLKQRSPHARIINLETAVTSGGEPWPGKGIHYRMHPNNIGCLAAAKIDCCVLANNHVLDWGYAGLDDTLETLEAAGIGYCGAGRDAEAAAGPAVLTVPGGRVLVFGVGHASSGIPDNWRAGQRRAGVCLLEDLSEAGIRTIARTVESERRPGDRVVVSIHWGGNWGYGIAREQHRFARALIDTAGADLVHGHSSHHPRPLEIHNGRLILYGCGDLINDYEGIGGHEAYRPELAAMYFPELAPDGRLSDLEIVVVRIRKFRLERAGPDDARWLAEKLSRKTPAGGARLVLTQHHTLRPAGL